MRLDVPDLEADAESEGALHGRERSLTAEFKAQRKTSEQVFQRRSSATSSMLQKRPSVSSFMDDEEAYCNFTRDQCS